MDRGAWRVTGQRVVKSWKELNMTEQIRTHTAISKGRVSFSGAQNRLMGKQRRWGHLAGEEKLNQVACLTPKLGVRKET